MHPDVLDEDDDIICLCKDCIDSTRIMIDRVHDAMLLVGHAGLPAASTDGSYVEMVAHQADIDFHKAESIIHETIEMARPGSPGRNSNMMYH